MRLDSVSKIFKFYYMLLAHRTARHIAVILPKIYNSYNINGNAFFTVIRSVGFYFQGHSKIPCMR